jgi:hypothetical protein
MIRAASTRLHGLSCANRSPGTAWLFIAFCGIEALACWRSLAKPRQLHPGAFFVFFQVYALLVTVFLFAALKCVRERLVLGLALVDCVGALSFEFAPGLASFTAGMPNWINLALWLIAFVVSVSMLASASRKRSPSD